MESAEQGFFKQSKRQKLWSPKAPLAFRQTGISHIHVVFTEYTVSRLVASTHSLSKVTNQNVSQQPSPMSSLALVPGELKSSQQS